MIASEGYITANINKNGNEEKRFLTVGFQRKSSFTSTRETTGVVKKAITIFAVGNTGALFLGPQTAFRAK